MTQPPTTPDGAPGPDAPTPPTFGTQAYAAPAPDKGGRRKWRALGGVGAVVGVILVKILVGLGAGEAVHGVEHRAGDAEKVVKAMWTTNGDATRYFVPGFDFRSLDPGCVTVIKAGGMAEITGSKKESDGSADVTLDPDSGSSIHFHLVDRAGWLIDGCTG